MTNDKSPFLLYAVFNAMADENTDEILGITRCARCGQRLEGEISCPVCSGFDEPGTTGRMSSAVFLVACFLSSPLSLPVIWRDGRLVFWQRLIASSGMFFWVSLLQRLA